MYILPKMLALIIAETTANIAKNILSISTVGLISLTVYNLSE